MVGFIIAVALINVCVGYTLAVRFGYGPPGLWGAWIAMSAEPAGRGNEAPREAIGGLAQQVIVTPAPDDGIAAGQPQ